MESFRDVDSRSSPMTSARDSLWRNIRVIGDFFTVNHASVSNSIDQRQPRPTVPVSSTASVSNNNHNDHEDLFREPVIVHDENQNYHSNQSLINREGNQSLDSANLR